MQRILKLRIPAFFCALAVLLCELIARPYANMGICDDGPYILVAKNLAATGHIAYNGWSAAMLLWQLYLGAAFIKLFGYSFTTVRMSTLLVGVTLAFVLQRTLVLASISERNATIGTLALVLSPLYLLLSATFMSDMHGLFAISLCLYGCLRALQSPSDRSRIFWLCFAVTANAVCGTSRQLAWLGVLVMVPCTSWLMRDRRRVLLAGAAATLGGFLFILGCMAWLKHQPYTTPETFHVGHVPMASLSSQFILFFLDIPFLLLPVMLLFVTPISRMRPRNLALVSALLLGYLFVAFYPSHLRGSFRYLLEPTLHQFGSDWVTPYGVFGGLSHGLPQLFLPVWLMVLTTFAVFASLVGLILLILPSRSKSPSCHPSAKLTWKHLLIVLVPFATAYVLLLVYRAASVANDGTGVLFDRYALGLLPIALVCLMRLYHERVRPQLPVAAVFLIAIMATFGVSITHNTFAFYRARIAIAAELRSAGISDTSVDHGWEDNVDVELQSANHVNNPGIVLPANAYIPGLLPPTSSCSMVYYNYTPHIHSLYGISFDPNACDGPAPFAPVHYSRWLAATPGTLYAVKYVPDAKQ